jgi:hypothetical protein
MGNHSSPTGRTSAIPHRPEEKERQPFLTDRKKVSHSLPTGRKIAPLTRQEIQPFLTDRKKRKSAIPL